ncbi:MAG: DNA mismatch repair endonuclease MutL, partial [Peptostreptococcaceae bacterium]
KSNHAETINISDLINKLAIGNPQIQFKYVNNKKPMLNTPGDNKLISVIRSIYGKDVCENLIKVSYECEYFKVYGYIGNNNIYRANKNLQHIYINHRFVKSKIILDALSEAYKSIIPINKHAICFLNMEINPGSIDVNIHPTKLEIKFENEKEVYIELRDFLKKSLLNTPLIGKYETFEPNKSENNSLNLDSSKMNVVINNTKDEVPKKLSPKEELELLSIPYKADLSENKDIEVVDLSVNNIDDGFMSLDEALVQKNKDLEVNNIENKEVKNNYTYSNDLYNNSSKVYDLYVSEDKSDNDITKCIENSIVKDLHSNLINEYGACNINNHEKYNENNTNNKSEEIEDIQEMFFEENEKEVFSIFNYNVIGTIFDTYIILSKGSSMYLLDQHAAHEKVLYEKYMDKFYKSEINMQMLLDPVVVEVSNVDMLHIEKNMELFIKFGFEIEIFGNNHIMIRCVPTIFGVPESEKFILQIIDNIEDIKNNYELKGEKFASMACRAAIKANDKIKDLEINQLFKEMQTCVNPFTCPHGRPVIVEISKKEIEKMFKRIM